MLDSGPKNRIRIHNKNPADQEQYAERTDKKKAFDAMVPRYLRYWVDRYLRTGVQ